MKTLKIKELNIEVEVEETQKGVPFNKIKIPKGWRLLKGWEVIFLYENYQDKLRLDWFFVKLTNKFSVAWFSAFGNRAVLDRSWKPNVSVSGLGVRFCRDLK